MVPATEYGPTYFPYVPQKLGLFSRTTNAMLGPMQYPQCFPRNSQICGSSTTYTSTVPLFKSSSQMFYATQSILRPLSRTLSSAISEKSTKNNPYYVSALHCALTVMGSVLRTPHVLFAHWCSLYSSHRRYTNKKRSLVPPIPAQK